MSLAGVPLIGQVVSGMEVARAWSGLLHGTWEVVRRGGHGGRPGSFVEGGCQRRIPEARVPVRGTGADLTVVAMKCPVMGLERRGRLIQDCRLVNRGPTLGRNRMNKPKPDGKPFVISRRLVWEAWRRVKANRGAGGRRAVDPRRSRTILRGNLYMVWNRMCSGCYFPPPVRAVEIPKPDSGGVSVCSEYRRRRQGRADGGSLFLEPLVEPCSTRTPMAIGREGRPMTRSGHAGSGVGSTTG